MTPEEVFHFADRIAMIGVYEGLLYRHGGSQPDGMRVRLDDGTQAVVLAMCVDVQTYKQNPMWTGEPSGGYTYAGLLVIDAIHDHSDDTLRWRDERGLHVESCAAARA